MASLGRAGPVASRFERCADVPRAGVLLALPALLATGLLRHTEEHLALPRGYYGLVQVLVLMAFLALARIKSLEGLRYCAPGEWGKVLGLDRIPEVRTLREKLAHLGQEELVAAWAQELCQDWMAADPESVGTLYVDGHVRVYHGEKARLPRHYVSRQRLCLRATTDYWVNAADGQPFFVVHRPVDPGLLQVLEEELVPRLEKEVPGQPTPEQLAADPTRVRFTLVYDREGWSPGFMQRMQSRHIGVLTYHKYPGADWPVAEFGERVVRLVHGNQEPMHLAERRVKLSNGLEVREIRHLDAAGHQTAIVTTHWGLTIEQVAASMFARWSQENFLAYMRQHYALDRLVSYQVEALPETTRVVNPAWRKLDRQRRSLSPRVNRKLAQFGALNLTAPVESKVVEAYLQQKATLQQELQGLQTQLQELKAKLAQTSHHLPLKEVAEAERYDRLSEGSKDLVDTIKLIAYRAETAMSHLVREHLPEGRREEARRLLQSLYASEADLVPDEAAGTLTVRLPYPANPLLGRAVEPLCAELTQTETVFPTTKLRLIYELVASQTPRDREL
jgi:hypothetical protein